MLKWIGEPNQSIRAQKRPKNGNYSLSLHIFLTTDEHSNNMSELPNDVLGIRSSGALQEHSCLTASDFMFTIIELLDGYPHAQTREPTPLFRPVETASCVAPVHVGRSGHPNTHD